MTNPTEFSSQRDSSRQVVCSRCGTQFGCALSGSCWCTEETARLPMPIDGEDCLCPDCLRQAAAGFPKG